ncbi:hypothetical protein [Streptomyces ardesiacus]|uniref:hypothetical protein n=1 Tax=Streptomyces ardesiacus TaxID=285564 RepID=UPI00201E99BD|nr:hypothetical protein [Streptomyces ardesiacus]MCL7369617.1 hypothetical protein [Streptomyces ardesiacus]
MPSHHLPLFLAAYQYKFGRDVEAMAQHLIDDIAVGWDELGTDLLDGAPPTLVAALTGGEHWPSRTLDHLISPDGSPPVRMTVTDTTASDLGMPWGYILHPQGVEVISMAHSGTGPLVVWDTDPGTPFSDHPAHWPAVTTRRTPTTSPPSARPMIPPNPTYAPTVNLTAAAAGRSR